MSRKTSKDARIVFYEYMLRSDAYLSLSGTAIKVLNFFYMKRQMSKDRKGRWQVSNNGDIIFTYDDALELGFSKRAFRDALDRLINTGFIKINHHGGGLNKDFSTYEISDMWTKYKTDDFTIKKRKQNKRLSGIMVEVRKKRKQKQVTKVNSDK